MRKKTRVLKSKSEGSVLSAHNVLTYQTSKIENKKFIKMHASFMHLQNNENDHNRSGKLMQF